MTAQHCSPPFFQTMALPLPLLLLLSAVAVLPLGSSDITRGIGPAVPPSLFGWDGRSYAAAVGSGPPRPSFSPITPFLTPQSLPPPLFGGRTPPSLSNTEEGRRTAAATFKRPRERDSIGNSENEQKRRGEKTMREEGRGKSEGGMKEEVPRVMGEEERNPKGNYSRGVMRELPTNSSGGSVLIIPFPQPTKGLFDEMQKKERAELLVEKEEKDMERVKKDGGNGEEKKRAEEEKEERHDQNVGDNGRTTTEEAQKVPLAGRFAPMRKRGGGKIGGTEVNGNGRGGNEEGIRGESWRTEMESRKDNGRREKTEREKGSWEERDSSREWKRMGTRERERNEWPKNGQRERGTSDREKEEGRRQHEKSSDSSQGEGRTNDQDEEEGERQHERKGGDRRAESLLFSPLQGPFPEETSNGRNTIGKEGRRENGRREERVGQREGREKDGEQRTRGEGREERWNSDGSQQRSRNVQSPHSAEEAERQRPPTDNGRVASHYPNSQASLSSSSVEERVSREPVDDRQHTRAVQQRPPAVHLRAPTPSTATATLGFQRTIPDPNEFFPDKIRAAFPPFPKPFGELDEKQRKGNEAGRERGRGE